MAGPQTPLIRMGVINGRSENNKRLRPKKPIALGCVYGRGGDFVRAHREPNEVVSLLEHSSWLEKKKSEVQRLSYR